AWYTIDMGDWSLDPASSVLVTTGGIEVARPGLRVSTGNPHTVVALAETAELEAAELRDAPVLDPVPAQGANVEYIVMEPARAAAVPAHHVAGEKSPLQGRVEDHGGKLGIETDPNHEGTSGRVILAGPAVLVASGPIS